MHHMNKKALAVAIAGALVVPATASAIEYTISGQVNRAIRFADDGQGSAVQHIDNGASNTRFRFQGSEDIGNGMKAGIYIETAVASNFGSSHALKTGDGPDNAFTIRHSALFFSGNWGKVSLGHTSDAHDGRSFADLSNTWLVNEVSSFTEHGGAIAWRTSAGGTAGGTTLGSAFGSFDGGRRDVIRYDTPAMGPASAAVSIGNNERWSVGGGLYTALGGGELSMAAGYTDTGGTSAAVDDFFSVSASYLFSQGTSLTLMYGESDATAAGIDPQQYYAKLGHQWGNHAVSIHYGESEDISAAGEDNEFWGVGWVYTMRKDIELYAGYNNYELDRAGSEDIDMVLVGSRIKF
jgi:predicted porin